LGGSVDHDCGDKPSRENKNAGDAKGFREFHDWRRLEQSSAFDQGITSLPVDRNREAGGGDAWRLGRRRQW
jgi:hypothetical protein